MAIVFDTDRKHIVLDSSSESWAVIWSRWVEWHAVNRQWPLAFRLVGGIDLGSGIAIPPYFFLLNGWRVRPMEAHHILTLDGNGFVEGGGVPVVSTLGVFQVVVNYTVPVQAQALVIDGGGTGSLSDADATKVAEKVWAHYARSLTQSDALTTAQYLALK